MPFFPEVSIFSRSADEWKGLLYDDREMCSKPAPVGYSVSLTTAHLVAAPIYAMAFWTLYAEKSANFKFYKRYLATHAICNLLFELHLSVVMKPVLYLPYPMLRFTGVGVLRFINAGITFFIFLLIVVATCWSIVELFYYRFKLIADSNLCFGWVQKFASVVGGARLMTMTLTMTTVSCISLCVVGLFDQTMHKKKLAIATTFPEIMCQSTIVLPKTQESGIKPIHLFNISALFSVLVGSFVVGSTGMASLMALRGMVQQTKVSMRTVAMHKSFLISLYCQIAVHGVMLGFPILIYVISIGFDFDVNDVGYLAIIVASLHGAMSTLAMIVFNRPLYELAKDRILTFFFNSNNVSIRDISFISMVVSSQ